MIIIFIYFTRYIREIYQRILLLVIFNVPIIGLSLSGGKIKVKFVIISHQEHSDKETGGERGNYK
jgi:hypothetical protein